MINVLIVDDDQNYRYAIKNLLGWEKNGFKIVAEAVHGKQALQQLKTIPVQLIITDISMPQMNGVELIRYVKKEYPHIEIVALSAYDEFEFVKEALKCGALDYILKYDLNAKDVLDVLNEAKNKITHQFSQNRELKRTEACYSREIQKAINYIEEHFNEKITLSDIAAYVNLSANYLCNLFKEETKEQIVKYLNKVRIQHAKYLISNTNLKVYEVASNVGFGSQTYFSTTFKKITGMTVNEYKRKQSS